MEEEYHTIKMELNNRQIALILKALDVLEYDLMIANENSFSPDRILTRNTDRNTIRWLGVRINRKLNETAKMKVDIEYEDIF